MNNSSKTEFAKSFESGLFIVEIDGEEFACVVVDADSIPDYVTLIPYRHIGGKGDKAYRPSVAEDPGYESYLAVCDEDECQEEEQVTLRSLLTRSHGKLRAPYTGWKMAYSSIVAPNSTLTYERFMAFRDEPLSPLGDNECGEYYELRDHEVFHQSDGRMFITDFEENLYQDDCEASGESEQGVEE